MNKIKARLEAANVHISSLSINLFTRSITLHDVEWSQNSRKASLSSVQARGIGIIPWFKKKRISIRRISFNTGTLSIPFDSVKHAVKADSADSVNIPSIDIDRLSFNDIDVNIAGDSVTTYEGKLSLNVHFLFIKDLKSFRDPSTYMFRNISTSVQEFRIKKEGGLYAFRVKELTFDKELKELHVDSLILEPLLNRTDFAKKVKSQETRVTLKIASVDASGVNMAVHMEDTSIMVSSVAINGLFIHAYKNKKYPFNRKEKFPLPMESFQSLHFGIEVDTVKIRDGQVTYEELPTEGFHTAHITFESVQATMNSVNNREFKNLSGVSTLEASAKVMKTGDVKATFNLPLEANKKYTAEGSISNVPLRELNPLLKDLAFVEIASGRLNKLDFNFTYDDIGSKGQLYFDYEDLKILGLKKEREKDVDQFKTLLVNIAVKNDETLAGTINVERNQKKAVFNLWTISIADGIRDAVLPGKKNRNKDNKARKAK